MRYTIPPALLVLVVAATAAAQTPAPTGTSGGSPTASAALRDISGREVGQARFQQGPHGLLLRLDLKNMTPGVHALHIHEVGRCDPPSFDSAGGHLAPGGRAHGFLNPSGPHAGDLPNITVPASTELSVELLIPALSLEHATRSLLDADGSAIVIHAGPDDHATDPAGAAGDRLACGVIGQNTGSTR